MKKLIYTIIILTACFRLGAQQEHQYTQFMYNKLLINPAYAGARGVPSFTGIYRNQWLGFEGAPQSALLSFSTPFLGERAGLGVTISHNKIGLQRDFIGSFAYSYNVIATQELSLRIGVMGSIRSLGISFDKAKPDDLGDQSLLNDRVNDIYGNAGAGIYATFSERVYVGFSVPRIYQNFIGISNNNAINAKEYRHYYAMAGAIIPISEDVDLLPAFLVKHVQNAPTDVDINLNLDIRQKVTAGISYRVGGDGAGESVDLLVYWRATEHVGIGASYDFTLSSLKDYNAGSIELLAQTDLKSKNSKNKKKMTNPRFFM